LNACKLSVLRQLAARKMNELILAFNAAGVRYR
jgi:hypothetical protein